MILSGSQRGGGSDLAAHLMKDENDHIEVHELRGFASETLHEAFREAHAISKGTRCRQFLFSLSLNPPLEAEVRIETFEAVIDRVEQKLGLAGQPRAIVFHEKEGPHGVRRHAHAVWSRINVEEMKAVQLSFTRTKLRDLSRELFIEHGWKMPEGYADSSLRDPKNFTLAEWQQSKRAGTDPREIKAAFQDAWAISDSKAAFTHALQERGYKIARGDRRGYVGVDVHGEVYSIPRQANVKTREVRERLGDENALPSVADVKDQFAQEMLPRVDEFAAQLEQQDQQRRAQFARIRKAMVARQRAERKQLHEEIEARRIEEAKTRQSRFRRGLTGVWDRLRGEHRRIRLRNKREAEAASLRDRSLKENLVFPQIEQRRQFTRTERRAFTKSLTHQHRLSRDRRAFEAMGGKPDPEGGANHARRNHGHTHNMAPPIRGPSRDR